ncbi:CPBP family intramembrane glutamic endopeptidase [Clostridium tetani]|uniref:CPBP family intramembrane metalloprotease n=1 Tax=Clostridium tetani TaxID=1513 RepID=A0ABY0ETA1_CLOTA|nr:CPBP family intramembrane glutamic endopeptidase [Clostridium tetani]KHO32650.1 CAAX protease [Clostridium tetani]RXI39350.1 CPBP family intramembrane metalloprotease [Clostridium tetani]RXI57383.1 CPBP family intramembrane metalloprotease [Clostridium tetani]RXI66961.1 CPBP family intramembrane metalloprotease [Clostridium tetani]
MADFLKNIVVYIFIYLPPLIMFWKVCIRRGKSKFILLLISVVYLVGSLFTQNLLPFIFTIINIIYMKREDNYDYRFYKFNFKNFNLFKAIGFSVFSYVVTILVAIIALNIFSSYEIPIKDQEIVEIMSKVPLEKFIFMMPITMIFAPVVEEYIFRWVIFEKVLKGSMGIFISTLLSSIIFALIHFNIKSFPAILWIGIFNCFLIHKKGYWYAVFNHSFFNSVSTITILIQKLNYI